MKQFIKLRIKSVRYVLKGMFLLLSSESAIKAQTFIFLIFVGIGLYCKISLLDWALQFFCYGLVLTAESLNTAIEKICDYIQPEFDKKIGFIKDISAGAVGFAAFFSAIVTFLIYYKYI